MSLFACGNPEPPLEQLELRDALLADPAVITGLPAAAQQQLAGRFWTAMAAADLAPETTTADPSPPEQRLRRFDSLRKQHGQDAFLSGVWEQTDAIQTLTPLAPLLRSTPSAPLPLLQGAKSTLTKVEETRALTGRAGAVIEELRRRSGAVYLERVTSWPVALVALGDRLYVNASWLTAVAALESGELPITDPGILLARTQVDAISTAGLTDADDDQNTLPPRSIAATRPQALSPGEADPGDPSSAAASATGSSGSCVSCSSPQACSNSTSPSSCDTNPCVSSADKQCCRACAIAPEHREPDLAPLWMMLWLGSPLLLLAGVDLRTRAATRRARV